MDAFPHTCKRILVVDDDPAIREAFKDYLEFEGFDVKMAENGQDALSILKIIERPCLILLDLMMPIMNGWEFAKEMRKDPLLDQIPIIVISAFSNKAHDIKAKYLMDKPPDLEKIIGTANECCH